MLTKLDLITGRDTYPGLGITVLAVAAFVAFETQSHWSWAVAALSLPFFFGRARGGDG